MLERTYAKTNEVLEPITFVLADPTVLGRAVLPRPITLEVHSLCVRKHARTHAHALAPAGLLCSESLTEGILRYGAMAGCPIAFDVAAQSGRIQTFQSNLQSSS
jgi:hypothetical protein